MSTATVGTPGAGSVGPEPRGQLRPDGGPTADHAAPPLRLLPVPLAQPHPALRVVRDEPHAVPAAQGTLALPLVDPPGGAEAGRQLVDGDGRARVRPGGRRGGRPDGAAPPPAPQPDGPERRASPVPPEPGPWAAQFVQAALEVTAGLRPPSQLLRWTNDEVRALLVRRAALARRAAGRERQPRRGAVRSTRVCVPRDGVAEVSVVVSEGVRFRAVAVRLEASDSRWRVTALRIG